MNTETGQVYRGLESILAAEQRGEPIARVSEDVANGIEIGMAAIKAARAYVQKVPETAADHAAVAAAESKRERKRQRNVRAESES